MLLSAACADFLATPVKANNDIVAEKLITQRMSGSCFRKLQAQSLMRHGDVEPSHLPSLKVLRTCKSQAKRQSNLDADPVKALLSAKYMTPYSSYIRDIGSDKFFVHYWSAAQISVYRSCLEAEGDDATLSIDATGGVVRRLSRPCGKSSHVFLYSAVINDSRYAEESQYSVCKAYNIL